MIETWLVAVLASCVTAWLTMWVCYARLVRVLERVGDHAEACGRAIQSQQMVLIGICRVLKIPLEEVDVRKGADVVPFTRGKDKDAD